MTPQSWRDGDHHRHALSEDFVNGHKRLRIIEAVASVVAVDGYDQASIARIVKAGGVARKTLYDLFANRQDVFEAMVTHAVRDAEAAMLEREGYKDRLAALVEWIAAHPDLALSSLAEGPRLTTHYPERMDYVTEQLGLPEPTAALVAGGIEWTLRGWLIAGKPVRDDLVAALVSFAAPYFGEAKP